MIPGSRRDEVRFRREFLAEAEELLENAQQSVAGLFRDLSDPDPTAINSLFRAVHSLKGAAGMIGLTGVSGLAHELESILDSMRLGKIPLNSMLLEAISFTLDALKEMTRVSQATREDPSAPPAVLRRLRQALDAGSPQGMPTFDPASILPAEIERMLTDYERHRFEENVRKGRCIVILLLEFPLETFDLGLRKGMDEVSSRGELIGTFPGGVGQDPTLMTFRLLAGLKSDGELEGLRVAAGASGLIRLEIPVATKAVPRQAVAPKAAQIAPEPVPLAPETLQAAASPSVVTSTLRVSLEKISNLLDIAGELALARWALKTPLERALLSASDRQARFAAQRAFSDLERAVSALSRAALAVRLIPVDQLTGRLVRAVEGIARSLGKHAVFEVVGGDTEIDKVLAEELADPLLHLVRNAIDHGIESVDERMALGKPAEGHVTLLAETRGREVLFTLKDDGRGIDPAAILQKAREKGILAQTDPDPPDPFELLFSPGFSTAGKVSEISGRGVGLDVVRSNIATLKGRVQVKSQLRKGTTFLVTVPMTLILVESLLVRSAGVYFALPTSSVRRTFPYEPSRVEIMDGYPFIGDEGKPLPLHRLDKLLGFEESPGPSQSETVIVAEQGVQRAGFLVSSIEGMRDVVVKPIAEAIPRSRIITGAAELPGGNVAFALDAGLLLNHVLSPAGLQGVQ